MAESLGIAVLELVADTKPLVAGLEKGKAASEEMARTTAGGFKNGITKAAIPAALAVGALVVGLHKSIDAAEEDQIMQSRLAAAYKTAGLNVDDYKGSIDKTVESSAALGFKSNDVKQSLGSLIVATQDHTKSLHLLGIAQDIARFKGTSLEASTKMMTMAMAGSQRAIKQLGLTISPVTTEEDKLKLAVKDHTTASYQYQLAQAKQIDHNKTEAAVIQLVSEKLHGQADAYANTAAGAKEKMGAELQLLEENIGSALLPALTAITTALASVTEWMTKHAAVAKIVIAVVGTLGTAILLLVAYTKAAAAAQAVWNMAMDANPIGLIIIAIAALVVAFVVLWKHSQTFRDIVLGVWDDVRGATIGFIDFFTKRVPGAFQDVKEWLGNRWGAIKNLITSPFDDAWQFIRDIPGKIVDAFGNVKDGIARVLKGSGDVIKSLLTAPINGVIGLIDHIEIPKIHINMPWPIPDINFGPYGPFFHIPYLAEGGIVTSPTLAMIGEAGPEAVVPLSKAHGAGLGGGITVNVSGVVGNEREVAVTIGRELQRLKSRGLSFGLA